MSKAPKLTGRNAGRLPRTGNVRIHTHIPPLWRRAIDRAAKVAGVSRSNFIANAAYKAAVAALKVGASGD